MIYGLIQTHLLISFHVHCDVESEDLVLRVGGSWLSSGVDLLVVRERTRCAPIPRHPTFPSLHLSGGYTEVDKPTGAHVHGKRLFQI
jgi:hypothetical protein